MKQQFHDCKKQIYLASSLYDSVEDNDINSIKILLKEKEANPNVILPDKGISPFHLAVGIPKEKCAEEITKLFLHHGGNPNIRSEDNLTPIHVTAVWDKLTVLKLLVNYGGDINLKDDEGYTALDYAKFEEHTNIVDYLQNLNKSTINETEQNNYNRTLEKIIVNNGKIIAEYDVNVENINNYLKNLPKNETNSYVESWCVKHQNTTKEYITNNDESFIIKSSFEIDKNKQILFFDDSNVTRRKKKINDNDKIICFNNLNEKKNSVCDVERRLFDSIIKIESEDENIFELNIQDSNLTNEILYSSIESINHKNLLGNTFLITSGESFIDNIRESGIKTFSDLSISIKNSLVPIRECKFIGPLDSVCISETSKYESCSDNDSLNDHNINIIDSLITSDASEIQIEKPVIENSNFNHVTGVPCEISDCITSDDTFISITEEYKYTDKEDGVVFIERRYLVKPQIDPDDKKSIYSAGSTVASSLPTTIDYDSETLRNELKRRGEEPGPITTTTKKLYLRKLMRLQKKPSEYVYKPSDSNRVYSVELEKTIRNPNWKDDLTQYKILESTMIQQFTKPDPSKKWREGVSKASFTYLLLDPRITQNLPIRSEKLTMEETWKIFLSSIFYVGKGKRSRPYIHLYDAFTHWKNNIKIVNNKKIQYILDIWNDGKGVVCLHIFQNVIPVEAYTREAAIISAIKLENLKNSQNGNFYGISNTWPQKQKRLLGVYLLYRSMLIFLNEGERQLMPNDI